MERQHPSSYDERKGITKRPIVIVQMPSSPDERRFYTRILEVLGAPYSVPDQIGALAWSEAKLTILVRKSVNPASIALRFAFPKRISH